jgi:hypothetical protein
MAISCFSIYMLTLLFCLILLLRYEVLLVQVLEKHTHPDTPQGLAVKLWSPLRSALLAFLCEHPSDAVAYFLNMEDSRIFKEDYFWLLHDIVLHPSGSALLDALCAAGLFWDAILDRIRKEMHDGSVQLAGGDLSLSAKNFRVLHLMASIVDLKPEWLSHHRSLWAKFLAFWDLTIRRLQGPPAVRRERTEGYMLAKIMLSYIDRSPEELPRICDLFMLFEHQVRTYIFET